MTVFKKISSILLVFSTLIFISSCNKDNDSNGIGVKNGFNYSKGPGQSAQDYVNDSKFKSVTVEILHMESAKPTANAVSNLKSFLENFLDKTTIGFVYTSIPDGSKSSYSFDEIRGMELEHRTVFNSGDNLSACLFFVDADFSGNGENGSVLGVAYNNTSMAVFEKTLKDNTGGIFQPSLSTVETTVMEHEFGHIMGLVNNGAPLQSDHHDSANGAHCDVQSCLMYFAVEGSDFLTNLQGGNVPQLDAQCQADLNALR